MPRPGEHKTVQARILQYAQEIGSNHGKLWKSLMRAHLGDYERQEERLNKIAPAVRAEW